ncbi:MAG TPA: FHA domain-containing protein [Thermoanaerobaculia bacterium]|nr:FHA domain-containing protein [Thermoanaerobaculia bacterium]
MIIECPNCHSKYQYDEERFERKPSKKIKCARCQQIFEIHNPAFARPEPAPIEVGERTFTSRDPKPMHAPDTTEQSPLPERHTGRTEALQLPPGKRLSLAILDGPDAGTVFRVEKPRVTIGRANADLTLNDTEASRQHAVLEVRETGITVSDLGSTNGTLVNGEKIEDATELSDKSEFQVGATTLMLIVTEDHA